ncbi:MAG: exodeoxyribonuclease V subunit beta [Acidobacteriota bacterium]
MNQSFLAFDALHTPLHGRRLIEASAGTGKTHAIASLYLRLLIERDLEVRRIVVVTFTEAATADLKHRIRERIGQALEVLGSQDCEDDFLHRLKTRVDLPAARHRLQAALQSFDEAAIFTIHGFCQRVLRDSAFESGSLLDTELISDQSSLIRQAVEDFWRIRTSGASAPFLRFLHDHRVGPALLLKLSNRSMTHPFLNVIPKPAVEDPAKVAGLEAEVERAFARVCEAWPRNEAKLRGFLLHDPGLNRQRYPEPKMEDLLRKIAERVASGDPFGELLGLERVSESAIRNGMKRGATAPKLEFFRCCEELIAVWEALSAIYAARTTAWKAECIEFARSKLREGKRRQNQRFFDDLLLDLYEALGRAGGSELARTIRERYGAVLIDEFQDTDPLQYAIFRAIWPDDQASLFLIGDPKQAIYSFRGADVFAYLQAARDVAHKATLGQNWRSTPRLVQAVNALFSRFPDPFVLPDIRFQPVAAAREEQLVQDGKPDRAPFKIWFVERESGSAKHRPKEEARQLIARALAGEIVRMIEAGREGRIRIGDRNLGPQDIAVLVRTNADAQLIQRNLNDVQVPTVLYTTGSVFETEEARDVDRVLRAVAEPLNEGLVKGALTTILFGKNGDDLTELAKDELRWSETLNRFAAYRDQWLEQGFYVMARYLLDQEEVRPRVMSLPDGERRLTNLLQCLELLNAAAVAHDLALEGVLKWLAERRLAEKAVTLDEHQMRLETDEEAVRVATIHRSKGLEYPIVFCPFCWADAGFKKKKDEPIVFHDPEQPTELIQDLGSDALEEHRKRAHFEALAENARLLYVAVTRAKYRCVLAWGPLAGMDETMLARLLHPNSVVPDEVATNAKNLSDVELRQDLERLSTESAGAIEVLPLPPAADRSLRPAEGGRRSYSCRRFHGQIVQDWNIASFTSLVSGKQGMELPDRDAASDSFEGPPLLPDVPQPESIFAFPKGVRAGLFFHDLFPSLDFSLAEPQQLEDLVRLKLTAHGFEPAWQRAVVQLVRNTLAVSLPAREQSLQLRQVKAESRVHELEFAFPVQQLRGPALQRVFRNHGGRGTELYLRRLEQLEMTSVRGSMRGFIDLVFEFNQRFYLVDWKSNHLGNDVAAYDQSSLQSVMAREWYFLQYHLYAIALHRYLKLRQAHYRYEEHFGGVFYLFLRGIDPERGSEFGVHWARPSAELVESLNEVLS